MTAREKFHVGQRVHLYLGCRGGSVGHGTVTGFGEEAHLVEVQRDGRDYAATYHMNHWKPCRSRRLRPARHATEAET